jgi:tetratricopeptide (TPR) repeat protein/predicted membrane-bound spermidine synthase
MLALLSGCCGLAYEVLYVRSLTVILGDMFYVHAALLSTFLIGIGLGSKWAYKFLRWLWAFEILTGLYAFALPIATKWLSEQPIMVPLTSRPLLTVSATIAFISIPALLVGFSVPLFSAYIKKFRPEQLCFQRIYRIYNLGAVISILGVELALIRLVGIRNSLVTIGVINIFNGLVLLLLKVKPADIKIEKPLQFPKRFTIALAMGSLVSAVFQMHFLKLSYLVFYPHRENFALSLAITMLGIFLGAWLASKIKISFQTCLLTAAVLIAIINISYMPILRLYEATVTWARSSEFLVIAHKFLFGCIFALGPMILFGALIPVLMRAETRQAKEVAEESGHLLWVSSFANATGYLVYVFIGHPRLNSGLLLALLAGLLIAASLISSRLSLSKLEKILIPVGVVLSIILVMVWQDRDFYLAHWATQLKPQDKVTIYKSDAESATLVETDRIFKSPAEAISKPIDEYIWQDLWITYNGHPSITVQRNGVVNFAEISVGIIPALSAPSLEKALVIGLGTGITAGSTSQVFDTTDVVEINAAFFQMIPALSYANMDIAHNNKAILHLSDGRAFLVGKEGQYDLIVSTVSAPTYFSASKIYTVDFYRRVKKALKDGGVFSVWISAGDMSREGMFTILSALRHNFDYCSISLLRGYYYLLTCSNEPIEQKRLFSQLPVDNPLLALRLKASLPEMNLDYYFQDIMLTDNVFRYFEPNVPQENTDDHPVLEFMVVRDYQLGRMGNDPFLEKQTLFNIDPVREAQLTSPSRFAHRAFVFWRLGQNYFNNFQQVLMSDANAASQFFLLTGKYNINEGKYDDAIKQLTVAANIRPDSAQIYDYLGQAYIAVGDVQKAKDNFLKAINSQADYAPAYKNLAEAFVMENKENEAINNLKKAIEYRPDYLKAYAELGSLYTKVKQFDKADEILNKGLSYSKTLNSDTADIHLAIGRLCIAMNDPEQARKHFQKAAEGYNLDLQDNLALTDLWTKLADTYEALGQFDLAVQCYNKAIKRNPESPFNYVELALLLSRQKKNNQAVSVLEKAIVHFSDSGNDSVVKMLENYILKISNVRNQSHTEPN